MNINGLKLMLLGIAVMLLGGFVYSEVNSGNEILIVLMGFFIVLYGFFEPKKPG